jgi:hypothetical protein
MDETDPEQQFVMDALMPILGRVHAIFPTALTLYNEEVSPRARAEHNTRAIANAVWCHVWEGFRREFMDEPGFHFLDRRGLNVLNMRDQLLVRAKKVDENGRHRNAATKQQLDFDAQLPLEGLPSAAVRIVIGYQPDEAFSEIERVTVRRPKGLWVSQIVDVEDAEQQRWVDITPLDLFRRRRAA